MQYSCFRSALIWLAALLLGGLSGVAHANTEFQVSSAVDGKAPYLVVIEDQDSGSTRAPGIYVPEFNPQGGGTSAWVLVIPGTVLRGRASMGILEQLAISQVTRRYESLAVVNGRLNILGLASAKGKSATHAVFGQGELEIHDPLTGDSVDVPEIQSIEQVQVFLAKATDKGQLLMVSIQGNGNRGVTFGVYVSTKASAKGVEIIGKPLLLDQQFRSSRDLAELVIDGDSASPRAISARALKKYAVEDLRDAPDAVEFKQKIGALLARVSVDPGHL